MEKSDWWVRHGNFLVIVVVTTLLMGAGKMAYLKVSYYLNADRQVPWASLFSPLDTAFALLSSALVVAVYLLTAYLLKRWMGERRVALRYGLQFFLTAVFGGLAAAAHAYAFRIYIYGLSPPDGVALFDAAVQAFVTPLALMAALETFYYRGAWLKERVARQQRERDIVTAKFEALSGQLSPHFVFNSFNILSGLIDEDRRKAQQFLNQLSMVYRYILETKDKDTVSLGRELDSVMSFMEIQNIRHPGLVNFDVDISDHDRSLRVVPLTLHTLIENMFKHNQLSAEQPLHIRVAIERDGKLVVENTLNEKLDVESHNIGLSNLSRRYELLQDHGLDIVKSVTKFTVHVPVMTAA